MAAKYGSTCFRQTLAGAGMRQSMSARATPDDNARTRSFSDPLKAEALQGGCFENAADARREIFDDIAGYYHTRRKHSALDYLTASQFETRGNSLNQGPNWSRKQLHLAAPRLEAWSWIGLVLLTKRSP